MGRFVCIRAALAFLLAVSFIVPPNAFAQSGNNAGHIAKLIPAVSIERGAQRVAAAQDAAVLWEDVVATQRMARARIALDDGSVLNVGSESKLKITSHDAASHRTDLELTYGRVRSKVIKSTNPATDYRVRSPIAVAGVVGTDFFFEYLNGVARLIVYEGIVKFCNLAEQCVMVNAGATSSVRNNQPPSPPQPVSSGDSMQATRSTDTEETLVEHAGVSTRTKWIIVGTVIATAVILVVVVPKYSDSSSSPGYCIPGDPNCGRAPR